MNNRPLQNEMPPPLDRPAAADGLLQLMGVMEALRGPDGCPWDREQTPRSLIPYLLEETYEVIESIEEDDATMLQEELGDLMLHIVFQAKMAEEQDKFNLANVLTTVCSKLVRRHPHVFGDAKVDSAYHVNRHWEAAKQQEKGRTSRLEGVPRSLPALTRARRIQEKAAYVGFDWPSIEPVWEKVHEEIDELQTACVAGESDDIEEELGDVLFSLVNLGRFLGLSSEGALRRAIGKFEYRFQQIEAALKAEGKTPEEATLDEMDTIWDRYRKKPPADRSAAGA